MEKTVYLMTYDHGGYVLWEDRFYEKLLEAEKLLEKYPFFKIGLDNESFAYEQFGKTDPRIVKKIREMLKRFKGRFGIGASTYGQPLSVFISEESNVRQLTYAIKTNTEVLGVTPPVYAISEHALHSQLPQLLKSIGYESAIMRTHFMMYGYNPTIDAPYCSWAGEDGSEIPTVPTYDGEGAQFAKTTVDNWFLTRWPDKTEESPEDFVKQFSHIEPLLASRYDDMDLRCEKMIEYTKDKKNYKWVLLEDLKDIYKDTPQTPFAPKANDFKVRMPWGYCGGRLMRLARLCETGAAVAERCAAAASMLSCSIDEGLNEKAWKYALIVQHHDLQICGLTKETEEFAKASLEASDNAEKQAEKAIADSFIRKADNNVIVFNPLDRAVKVPVKAKIRFGIKNRGLGFVAVCMDEKIPCGLDYEEERKKKCIYGTVYFTAELKPFSAKCYAILPDDEAQMTFEPQSGSMIETSNYKIALDEGGIKSIYHKKQKRYIANGENSMLFKGIIDSREETSRGAWSVFQQSGVTTAYQTGTIGKIEYNFRMSVYDCSDRIECGVTFRHHGEKIGSSGEFEFLEDTNGFIHENKLRFALPCGGGRGVRDLPFLISETDDKYIQGNYWTGIEGGFAYLNRGAMCAVKEKDCLSLPLEYSNDYVWGKRILFGECSHEFAIYPFDSKEKVHTAAYEYNYKPLVFTAGAGQGKYSEEIVFLKSEMPENVLTTALYPQGDDILMRMYEISGKPAKVKIDSDFVKAEAETDLMGNEFKKADEHITLKPKEIKTILLSKKK